MDRTTLCKLSLFGAKPIFKMKEPMEKQNETEETRGVSAKIFVEDYSVLVNELDRQNTALQKAQPGAKRLTLSDLLRPLITRECDRLRTSKKGKQ